MSPSLAQFQDDNRAFQLMQNSWASVLNPLLNAPLNQSVFQTGIVLKTGSNTINTKLGRKLQGWIVVGQNAAAALYDVQATNQNPEQTLILNASAPVTINLICF